jgi:hypothetical protein
VIGDCPHCGHTPKSQAGVRISAMQKATRTQLFYRQTLPEVRTIQLSESDRFITLFEKHCLKRPTQPTVIDLANVKAESHRVLYAPTSNNTVAEFYACPSEITKSGLGCAGPETVHLCRQAHYRCSITVLKCDSETENFQQPLSYSMRFFAYR